VIENKKTLTHPHLTCHGFTLFFLTFAIKSKSVYRHLLAIELPKYQQYQVFTLFAKI